MPFTVPQTGVVGFGSVFDEYEMEVPPGDCLLHCVQLTKGQQETRVLLNFDYQTIPRSARVPVCPEPQLLPDEFDMNAEAA